MPAWVLNGPLFFEDSSKFFEDSLNYFTLYDSGNFFKVLYFFSFIKHAIKHLIIKPFDLLNIIPLRRTRAC